MSTNALKLRNAIRRRKAQKDSSGLHAFVSDVAADTAAVQAEAYFAELTQILTEMTMEEIKALVSKVKKGDKGDKGDDGKPGKSIRGPQGNPGKNGKDGKGIKGDKGDAGKDGSQISAKELLEKINSYNHKIEIKTIKGLDLFLKNIQRMIREKVVESKNRGHRHGGGGMTIDAGSNITLTRNSNGRWTIASTASGGSNIATEQVTAVQSGDHVAIDLTQLAHTYTGILFVTRTGQVLMPNGNDTLPGSSWSQSGDVVTVYNAGIDDVFLVQYMYA